MDDQQTRGRPVLKRISACDDLAALQEAARESKLWIFCGEYDGSEKAAVDIASDAFGAGIFKTFPSGSWPGGYLRD